MAKSWIYFRYVLLALWVFPGNSFAQYVFHELSLAGTWELALDSLSQGPKELTFGSTIQLPGTLEEASIGKKRTIPSGSDYRLLLQTGIVKKYTYIGKAWYRKKITVPSSTKGKTALLTLESVKWKSTLYIDGKEIGSENSLSIPHRYDITEYLDPGEHEIMICIDNSRQLNFIGAGTGWGQPWNGIQGDFLISFLDKSYITKVSIFPNEAEKKLRVKVSGTFASGREKIQFRIKEKDSGKTLANSVVIVNPSNEYMLAYNAEITPWDELNPSLYLLECTLLKRSRPVQNYTETFGFRKIEAKGKQLVLNGSPVFLRGTLGGGGGTDVSEWEKIFGIAKSYGLNHFRFHSHCPPEAAFEVADRMGVYLQVECPIWSANYGSDSSVVSYINEEAVRIIEEYGNHPSFLLMATGNEMAGDFQVMNKMISKLKSMDDRFLYAVTSFSFQEGHGMYPEPEDDFFVTQWTDAGWVRGQGYFDLEYPGFDQDFGHATDHIPVPVVTHEIGQHTFFPDLKVIDKYENLSEYIPVGYKAIKADLEKKGLSSIAEDYVQASGKLQVILYKEEVERALKTYGISGFQLLGIRDGGGNPIGVLNDFWEPKKYVDSTEFRQFCSEFVPLAWFEKAVFTRDEALKIEVGAANFYQTLHNGKLICEVSDHSGKILERKELSVKKLTKGKTEKYGRLEFDLSMIRTPEQLSLSLRLEGTDYKNTWPVWVYPAEVSVNNEEVLVTSSFHEAEKALNKGQKVLLSPPLERIKGNAGIFIPVFWSPTHFDHWERVSETGTMSLLLDSKHPAFSLFPTESHSNWQWWDLCKQSQTVNIDSLNVQPLIQVIDNYYKNRSLTNLFEAKVGKGLLVFSAIDLLSDLDERIEARQLRFSLVEYMKSSQFDPKKEISLQSLMQNFKVKDFWIYPAAKYSVIKRSDQ